MATDDVDGGDDTKFSHGIPMSIFFQMSTGCNLGRSYPPDGRKHACPLIRICTSKPLFANLGKLQLKPNK